MTTNAAVLVDLTIRQFGNEKTDNKLAREVALNHNATQTEDRYLKRILPKSALRPIQTQIGIIRTYHYQVTAPWFDRGIRMIAAAYMIPYQNQINQHRNELFKLIDKVAADIPTYEAEAMRTRGSLYMAGEMPTSDHFRKCFDVEIEFLPISTENDFRVDYISNKVKKKFAENNKERFAKQTEHLLSLIENPLLRLKFAMANQDRAPKIHSSTIDALTWWCDHINELLVDTSRSKEFDQIATEIRNGVVSGYDPDQKPKFDPHAIENALYAINTIEGIIKCIRE